MKKLTVTSDTLFKQRTKQARELSDDEKILVQQGAEFEVLKAEDAPFKHVLVQFSAPVGQTQKDSWYVFSEHIVLEGNEEDNNPSDEEDPEPPPERTGGFRLPGYRSTFYLLDPILPGGNFTWQEATKNGTRIPVSKDIVVNVLKIADTMQEVRELFGNRPIVVTSWYRDPVSNRRVGGASRSRHLTGGAVDFKIAGVSTAEVQRRLDPWWGTRGGLASASSFTHIDNRGYRARWRYGS
ncbi:MAG: D-Ala-D-Ala carboxypeptidase family metallohydrolase [Leptolyngbyaceae bacterium]|nr:D-Ala-D-Ala carboxypeptidase family metallohydrolase [Leptolyngbyaceae bacterium]